MDPMTMAMIASVGSGLVQGLFGSDKNTTPEFIQAPEYEEATQARSKISDTLSGYNAENMYGAVEQPWDDIWQKAIDKVNAYYGGTATAPGVSQQLEARLARSNMSDSPAAARSMTRLAAEQQKNAQDLAIEQAIAKAQFGENARLNWINSLFNLSRQKPAGTWNTPQPESNWADVVGQVGTSLGGMFGQQAAMANQPVLTNYGIGTLALPGYDGYGSNTPAGTVDMGNYSLLPPRAYKSSTY